MAELILTQEEKDAPSYLDFSDESLGKLVRKLALKIGDEYGASAVNNATISALLVDIVRKANSDRTTITLNGVTDSGEPIGDYEITIKSLTASPAPAPK